MLFCTLTGNKALNNGQRLASIGGFVTLGNRNSDTLLWTVLWDKLQVSSLMFKINRKKKFL